jgi:hypothetical protein
MNNLPKVGSVVIFGKRRGHIIGHSVAARYGWKNEMQVFALVDLDPESKGWLEHDFQPSKDTYISIMVVDVHNFDTVDGVTEWQEKQEGRPTE